ncbi:MAG: hypothetical protein MSC30_18565 [Gaiellaceae bacterium MAG52_C11]|nr:hypothetical protein [Candidatus Gaiellasilicea maunaloa]
MPDVEAGRRVVRRDEGQVAVDDWFAQLAALRRLLQRICQNADRTSSRVDRGKHRSDVDASGSAGDHGEAVTCTSPADHLGELKSRRVDITRTDNGEAALIKK